jgi:hypothetical protein
VREYKRNCNRSLDKEKEEKLEETKGVIRSRKRSTNNTMTKKNNKKNINNMHAVQDNQLKQILLI